MKKRLLLLLSVGILTYSCAMAQVVINEYSAANFSDIADNYGEYEDWIELYNAGTSSINLNGYSLTDNSLYPQKWIFPAVNVPVGGYVLVWASDNNIKKLPDTLHTNFKLSGGEAISIYNNMKTLVDSKVVVDTKLEHSYGRLTDGGSSWGYFINPTPKTTNNVSVNFSSYNTDTLKFSLSSGFYTGQQTVSISGGNEIRYTLDGSEPTSSSTIYVGPLTIDTNTVIKTAKFDNGAVPFRSWVASYIFNENTKLPVFSLSTNNDYFFDYNTGIYVKGPNADTVSPYFGANFWQDWERPLYIEYFNKQKQLEISQLAGVRIYGNYSRGNDMKSLALMAKSKYGKDHFKAKFYAEKQVKSFEDVVLRNGGGDFNCTHYKDGYLQSTIGQFTGLDYQAYQPSIVYLNGKFWGLHNIREKISADYISENHGIDKGDVDLIETWGDSLAGTNNIWAIWWRATNSNLGTTNNYKAVADSFNIESMIDYFSSQFYVGNWDWPNNNIKYWRNQKKDRRYNFILWDLDLSTGLFDLSKVDGNNMDSVFKTTKFLSPTAAIFKSLNNNVGFRNKFINRYADLMNSLFLPSNMKTKALQYRDSIAADMPRHFEKWPPFQTWDKSVQDMIDFLDARPSYARQHLQKQFALTKQVNLTLAVEPAGAGFIKINSIFTDANPWTGIYYDGVPVTITAIANPGFSFDHWQSPTLILNPLATKTHTLNIDKNETITAYFTGSATDLKLTVSEINFYSPLSADAGDWIELHNYGTSTVDLSSWSVTDRNDYNRYTFPINTLLLPDQRLIVCSDSVKFKKIHGTTNKVKHQFTFGLDNQSDEIRIFNHLKELQQRIVYNSNNIWDNLAFGQGYTLELTDSQLDATQPTSWSKGCLAGTPFNAFTTNCPVGITDATYEMQNLQISPNPNNGEFSINSDKINGLAHVKIISAQGVEMWSNSNYNMGQAIRLQNTSGFYLIELQTTDGKKYSQKVIIE